MAANQRVLDNCRKIQIIQRRNRNLKNDSEITQILGLADMDSKTVNITVFQICKKLVEIWKM